MIYRVSGYRAPFATSLGGACIALLSLATIVGESASPAHGAGHGRTPPPAWVSFTRAWAGITGYSATVTVFERKGAQVQNMALDYSFLKPSSATVHIIQGPNAGATLVWGGGTTMVAHRGSGFMALFKRTLSLHDRLALTIRGSSIDQLSFGAILTHAQKTHGAVSQYSGEVIKGVATAAVKLVATTSVSNTGLTVEVVEISKTTHLPVRVLGYEGRTLVRRIDFSNVKLAPNPSSTPIATPASSLTP